MRKNKERKIRKQKQGKNDVKKKTRKEIIRKQMM